MADELSQNYCNQNIFMLITKTWMKVLTQPVMTEECNSKGLISHHDRKDNYEKCMAFSAATMYVCIALLDAMFPFLFNSNL